MQHPTRRAAALRGLDPLDTRHSSYLGRLEFWSQISRRQAQAGLRWAALVGRYRSALGLPTSLPRAAMGNLIKGGGGGSPVDADEDYLSELRRQYDYAHGLLSKAGRAALTATRDACLYGLEVDVVALRRGLDALIAGLDLRKAA